MDYQTDYNLRAKDMWGYISNRVNFRGKTVLDLGCGYGDMLCYTAAAGAKSVVGVEQNLHIAEHARIKANVAREYKNVSIINSDIVDFIATASGQFDVGMCFSVIPYIDVRKLAYFIKGVITKCDKSLFEIQYYGDGPGLPLHKGDDDVKRMFDELSKHMPHRYHVNIIGRTYVSGRQRWRKIWLVEKRSSNE